MFVDLNDLSIHDSRLGYVVGSLVWAMEFNKWRS